MDVAVNKGPAGAAAWHAITVDEVLNRLATSTEKGLAVGEASTRLQKYGPNRLPEGKKRGPFMRFLAQLNNILVYVLLGAGFVKLMLGPRHRGAEEPVAPAHPRCGDHLRGRASQRAARFHPGRQG